MTKDNNQESTRVSRPRQAEVARLAGVSVSTVSKVINNAPGISLDLRERVLSAADSLGYAPTPSTNNHVEGLLRRTTLVTYYEFIARDPSSFYADILGGIMSEAQDQGIALTSVVIGRDEDESRMLQALGTDCESVLMMGADDEKLLAPLRKMDIPVVIVSGMDRRMQFDSISPAFRTAGYLATRHLLDLGHTDIVHVTHLYRRTIRSRLEGFQDALEEVGIQYDPQRHLIDIGNVMFDATAAEKAIVAHIERHGLNATAFFCASDLTALGVIQGLRSLKIEVPDDVSIVSFDDLPVAQLCSPPLTSISVDRTELGRTAMKRLLERHADRKAASQRIELGVRVVVRASDRPLAKR